jgi:glycolate oxidase
MATTKRHLIEKLERLIRGQVISDDKVLQQFSRDQSIYEIMPIAAVLPEDISDVQKLVSYVMQEGLPITPRGGGSGTAGSALGSGIVIALPDNAFWGQIDGFSEMNGKAMISVGSGARHNRIQSILRTRGLFLPADVTSADISCIGGNIATRASGPHSLKYGSISRFLEQVEFITAEGELVNTAIESTIPERFKFGLDDLTRRLGSDKASREALGLRKGLKTASGYDLSALLSNLGTGQKIVRLLSGSVGTLGFITHATLLGEIYEKKRAALLLYFDSLIETAEAVSVLHKLSMAAIELISRQTLHIIGEHTLLDESLNVDAHVLIVEMTGQDNQEKIQTVTALLPRSGIRMSLPPYVATSEGDLKKIWGLRKRILWLIQHPKPGFKSLAVVNDVGVPLAHLTEFITEAENIFVKHGITAFIYGHAGEGNLHLRPLFDITMPDLPGRIRRLADDIYGAVLRHNGTITSEHGMGRLRAPYLKREWGETLYNYMQEIKSLFDPKDIFNPGVMFGTTPITDHMRTDLFAP